MNRDRLEIIHLRSFGESMESLGERIRESVEAESKETKTVAVYRRHGLGTDLAIHFHYHDSAGKDGPSVLALHLANALRSLGLVEHTVWEEMQSKDAK